MWKKMNVRLVASVIGILILVIVGLLMFMVIRGKNKEVDDLKIEVEDLSWQVDVFGEIIDVYTVTSAKKSGEVFDQSDVETMALPSSQVNEQYITDLEELNNCIYKIDVEPGMPLVKGLFFREILTQTDRYADVVADLFPVGAKIGDYYDLRIVTPNGLDYIVLSKKRVVEFYGSAVRFILTEEEIHQYQSALVDTFINPGTYLYMSTYVEPAMQKRATIYYPVSDLVRAVMEIDPNIVQLAESDMIAKRRLAFEQGLEIDKEYSSAIVAGRSEQVSRLIEAANNILKSQPVVDAPSDGSEGELETGAVDTNTGNLMSSDLTGEDEAVKEETGGGNTSSAEERTDEMMKFNSSTDIVRPELQSEINKQN